MTTEEINQKNQKIEMSVKATSKANLKFADGFFKKIKYAMILGPVMQRRKRLAVDPRYSLGEGVLTEEAEKMLEADFMERMMGSSLTQKGKDPQKIEDAKEAISSFLDSFSVVGELGTLSKNWDEEKIVDIYKDAKREGAVHVVGYVEKLYEKKFMKPINESKALNRIESVLKEESGENITPAGPKQ